ncbi:unnamed protein product [Ectocarpus sp. 8 AP-2014]
MLCLPLVESNVCLAYALHCLLTNCSTLVNNVSATLGADYGPADGGPHHWDEAWANNNGPIHISSYFVSFHQFDVSRNLAPIPTMASTISCRYPSMIGGRPALLDPIAPHTR